MATICGDAAGSVARRVAGAVAADTPAPRNEGRATRQVLARTGDEAGSRGAEGENAGRFIAKE